MLKYYLRIKSKFKYIYTINVKILNNYYDFNLTNAMSRKYKLILPTV